MTSANAVTDSNVAFFFGVVHPIGGGWRIEQPIEMGFPDGRWTLTVFDGQFRVHVEWRGRDVITLRNEVMSIVQGCIDALGFHLGACLTAELTGGFTPGTIVRVGMNWPELIGAEKPLWVNASDLEPLVQASTAHPVLRLALSDLALAIARPDDTAFYAFRAIEGVRTWLDEEDAQGSGSGPRPGRSASWEHLHTQLGYARSDFDAITIASTQRRHAAAVPISEAERLEYLQLARKVFLSAVNRPHPSPG